MGVSQCLEGGYDLVFIDDVCSFLTPRLVTLLRQQGRMVVGVFDVADGPDAKRRLLECGISDVIEAQAPAEEYLELALTASQTVVDGPTVDAGPPPAARTIGVLGVSAGVGATEIAVNLASLASRRATVSLLDLDPLWPSVAQRLDLPPHPNLLSVVDVVLHGGVLDATLHRVGDLTVMVGSATQRGQNPIAHHELTMVLDCLAGRCELLVADLGAEDKAQGVVLKGFDTVVVVTTGDPIGIARLLSVWPRIEELLDPAQHVVAVNKTSRRIFQRGEIRAEISAALPDVPLLLLPFESRVEEAVWEGRPLTRGRYLREISRVAELMTNG